jgi:hypothetical protein
MFSWKTEYSVSEPDGAIQHFFSARAQRFPNLINPALAHRCSHALTRVRISQLQWNGLNLRAFGQCLVSSG